MGKAALNEQGCNSREVVLTTVRQTPIFHIVQAGAHILYYAAMSGGKQDDEQITAPTNEKR